MFSNRKYSPLPTSSNGHHRKRAGGGLPTWKRYILLGTAGVVIVVAGYAIFRPRGGVYDAPQTYTPHLDNSGANTNENYESPPFRPVHNDEDDKKKVNILPVDMGKPNLDGEDTDISFKETTDSTTDHDEVDAEDDSLPDDPGQGTVKHPTSFEEDTDAASTTHCTKPFTADKPLVQYALTIDAGSTGSRIHAYKFHNCGPSPQLEYETFMQLTPGLSSFAKDATAAAESLDPLLEEANRVVPKSLHKCTPVEVKATAGLRLLGEPESDAILEEVRHRLESKWPYIVNGDHAVEIMEGKDEGVYAWITTNYLLGKIGEGVKTTDTLAVMDLGGASTQIVFEPKFDDSKSKHKAEKLQDGDHKYELNFGGKKYTLYQHSHLNYGLMRARRSVHNHVAFSWSFFQPKVDWEALNEDHKVANPCLSHGTTRRVELDPPQRSPVSVTMYGGNGGFSACNRLIEVIMAKDSICEVKPCSFNGVYQPSLIDTFKQGDFFALSYFTDRILPLLPPSTDVGKLTLDDLKTMAEDVCAGADMWKRRWGDNQKAMDELEDRPEYCLDLTFMHGLLGLGYEIHEDRKLLVEKKINGVELGWALGAGLALVSNADLKCLA